MKLLKEILNTKVDFEVILDDGSYFKTRAEIGDRTIVVYARDIGEGNWEVRFKEVAPGGRSSHCVTGSGDELKVFSMVKDSIFELVKRYDPNSIMFTAEKDDDAASRHTRAELYDKLSKKFKIPNYRYVRTGKGYDTEYFSFIKMT